MKFLIWCVCIFVAALIQIVIRNAGIILGAIPSALLFLAMWRIAATLCKKYDEKKARQLNNKNDGME
jgi:hypothetical protein